MALLASLAAKTVRRPGQRHGRQYGDRVAVLRLLGGDCGNARLAAPPCRRRCRPCQGAATCLCICALSTFRACIVRLHQVAENIQCGHWARSMCFVSVLHAVGTSSLEACLRQRVVRPCGLALQVVVECGRINTADSAVALTPLFGGMLCQACCTSHQSTKVSENAARPCLPPQALSACLSALVQWPDGSGTRRQALQLLCGVLQAVMQHCPPQQLLVLAPGRPHEWAPLAVQLRAAVPASQRSQLAPVISSIGMRAGAAVAAAGAEAASRAPAADAIAAAEAAMRALLEVLSLLRA